MLASAEVAFLYGYSGGSPPPSLEVLTIGLDRQAQYFTANPWPKQPPFDEIGWYKQPLEEAEWAAQESALRAASRAPLPRGAGLADAGTEYWMALLDGQELEAEWHPANVPQETRPLVALARKLITRLRAAPDSTLQARLERASLGDTSDLVLWLHNRGQRPFRFFGSAEAEAPYQPEIRLRLRRLESAPSAVTPLNLIAMEPLRLAAPPGFPMTDGLVQLGAGASCAIELPQTWRAEAAEAEPGPMVVEGLVRVCFPRVSLAQEEYVEEGWMLPQILYFI